MAMSSRRHKQVVQPLDSTGLERLALFYAGRYAVTRAKLRTYLQRKLRERGWAEAGEPPVAALADRFAALGYVDDKAVASARADALTRRGYGLRRVGQALHAAGVEEEDQAEARERAEAEGWGAALRFAERRRIGPFAAERALGPAREKALAAMLRGGHPLGTARRLVDAEPGTVPDPED